MLGPVSHYFGDLRLREVGNHGNDDWGMDTVGMGTRLMGVIAVPLVMIPFYNCHHLFHISVAAVLFCASVCALRNGIPRHNIAEHMKVSAPF